MSKLSWFRMIQNLEVSFGNERGGQCEGGISVVSLLERIFTCLNLTTTFPESFYYINLSAILGLDRMG